MDAHTKERRRNRTLLPLAERGPLRVMFMLTSMPVGGAEMLLVNLIRGLDVSRFAAEICCLKQRGPLGEIMAAEVPVYDRLLRHKYDIRILRRLRRLLRSRQIDAVITVGCGDKMFWGRLAAWRERVPVIASALHSTGWPDGVGRLNRWLTPLTDAFIGVAATHGRHLIHAERFPAHKVFVIPNGIDTQRFCPDRTLVPARRAAWGIPVDGPLCVTVAALRSEKNHPRLIRVADRVRRLLPSAQFVIVGDGPERPRLSALVAQLNLQPQVHLLGTRHDVPALLQAADVFALTSDNEANPVSILEAMACGLPVVATRVGSVPEAVRDGVSGFLADRNDNDLADKLIRVMRDPQLARRLGAAGRQHVVAYGSLPAMVEGYEQLIEDLYERKAQRAARRASGQTGSAAEKPPALSEA